MKEHDAGSRFKDRLAEQRGGQSIKRHVASVLESQLSLPYLAMAAIEAQESEHIMLTHPLLDLQGQLLEELGLLAVQGDRDHAPVLTATMEPAFAVTDLELDPGHYWPGAVGRSLPHCSSRVDARRLDPESLETDDT